MMQSLILGRRVCSSPLVQAVCSQCCRQHKVPARFASGWQKKVAKREDTKERVVDYAGLNQRRADRVYAWGCATTGALGIASYLRPEKKQKPMRRQQRPARVKYFDENHIRPYLAACGYGFTVWASRTPHGHKILASGINTSSQLGYHEYPRNSGRVLDFIIEPVEIHLPLDRPRSSKVSHIGCGRAHTVIVTEGGQVFSLGNNGYGQCGRPIVEGENYSKSQLINVVQDLPEDVEKAVCGQDHTTFLTASGQLYACGMGADGQTGQGHYDLTSRPARLRGDVEGETIVGVHGRGDCVLAVSEKGDVFGWGNSEYGQLSSVSDHTQICVPRHLPFKVGRAVKAVAGGSICALLNEAGQVYVWGYGVLGKGPAVDASAVPTPLPPALFGRHELNEDSRVVDIECGLGHFTALTDSGDVYCWGLNREGCLGLGSQDNQHFPLKVSVPAEAETVVCGVDHTIALCKSFT